MLDQCIDNRAAAARLRSGVIGLHLDSFTERLAGLGYAAATVRSQVTLLGHFDQWMARRRFRVADLNDEIVEAFIDDRVRRKDVHRGDAATVHHFLAHLREQLVVGSPAVMVDESPLGVLQRQYEQHLTSERGLASATVATYREFFRWFLTERFGDGPMPLRDLDASAITTFVVRHAHARSPGRAKLMVTALRSILRFFLQRGAIERDLAACVPRVADWRLATLPKYLSPEEIDRLLRACDQRTSIGRRDLAILRLLAHLGLRAGEVVGLELDDIHWRAGEITVRGSKRLPHDRLPLLAEVGDALATYVHRDRPRHATRRVFLCTKAPRRGFAGPSTVSTIVQRALARAGLCPAIHGAHLLRHSLATRMLRQGASLSEIGQVLRHRAVNTTEIYAKVDLAGLRALAQPWPGTGGAR